MNRIGRIFVGLLLVFLICISVFVVKDIDPMPMILRGCPFGGTPAYLKSGLMCLRGYKDGTLCKRYCETRKCEIRESNPIQIECGK